MWDRCSFEKLNECGTSSLLLAPFPCCICAGFMLCSRSVCACAYFDGNVCATFVHALVLHVFEYTRVWCLVWIDTYTVLKVSEHLWELLLSWIGTHST